MKARALVASFLLCGIVTGGVLFATRSASAATNSTSLPVSVTCTSTGQECDASFRQTVTTTSVLTLEFESAWNGCATFSVTFLVDGAPVFTSAPLAPFTSTGTVDVGPVSSGIHVLEVRATGVTGGCDDGTLHSWAGRFTVATNDDPATVTPTPTEPPPDDTTVPSPSDGAGSPKDACKKGGWLSGESSWKNQGHCVKGAVGKHGREDHGRPDHKKITSKRKWKH